MTLKIDKIFIKIIKMAIKNYILLIILLIYNLLEMDKLNFATVNANGLRPGQN